MSQYTTDEQIARQVIKVPEMYGFLIDRYQDKLDRYIYRQSGLDKDRRADILQEVFIKGYENIASFNPNMSFNAWIYRICHNTVVNDWRKNRRYRDGLSFDKDEIHFLENLLSEDDSLKGILDEERSREVAQALDKIKPSYQEVLILKYFEEMSYEEISDVLKIPPGTVATNLHRAKKALSQFISDNK